MEKLPKFEVIGAVSEEEKKDFISHRKDIFLKQKEMLPKEDSHRRELERAEYDKTPEQVAVLNFIGKETNRLIQECGVEPFDIPIQNYHILPEKEIKKFFDTDSTGTYDSRAYAVGLSSDLRSNILLFTTIAFHETLHMKSRQVWELYKDKEGKIKDKMYRRGVNSSSSRKKDENGHRVINFSGLDEAIIAWQEKVSFTKLLDIPELVEEKKRRELEENKKLRQKISKERGIPEDEIFWTDPSDEKKCLGVSYREQREVLEYVCEEIAKEFSDNYLIKEDVLKEFLKATFSGNLIAIARLMKKTFGDMGLRVLGMMRRNNSDGGVSNILEMLKKMRRDVLQEER